MNQVVKAACGVLAAFAHVEDKNAQFPVLLPLKERDGEVDSEGEHIFMRPGRGNAISGSNATYVSQNVKDDSFLMDTINYF